MLYENYPFFYKIYSKNFYRTLAKIAINIRNSTKKRFFRKLRIPYFNTQGVSNDNYFNATTYKLVMCYYLRLFPSGTYHCYSSRFYYICTRFCSYILVFYASTQFVMAVARWPIRTLEFKCF